jgi:hypothetical protein
MRAPTAHVGFRSFLGHKQINCVVYLLTKLGENEMTLSSISIRGPFRQKVRDDGILS